MSCVHMDVHVYQDSVRVCWMNRVIHARVMSRRSERLARIAVSRLEPIPESDEETLGSEETYSGDDAYETGSFVVDDTEPCSPEAAETFIKGLVRYGVGFDDVNNVMRVELNDGSWLYFHLVSVLPFTAVRYRTRTQLLEDNKVVPVECALGFSESDDPENRGPIELAVIQAYERGAFMLWSCETIKTLPPHKSVENINDCVVNGPPYEGTSYHGICFVVGTVSPQSKAVVFANEYDNLYIALGYVSYLLVGDHLGSARVRQLLQCKGVNSESYSNPNWRFQDVPYDGVEITCDLCGRKVSGIKYKAEVMDDDGVVDTLCFGKNCGSRVEVAADLARNVFHSTQTRTLASLENYMDIALTVLNMKK